MWGDQRIATATSNGYVTRPGRRPPRLRVDHLRPRARAARRRSRGAAPKPACRRGPRRTGRLTTRSPRRIGGPRRHDGRPARAVLGGRCSGPPSDCPSSRGATPVQDDVEVAWTRSSETGRATGASGHGRNSRQGTPERLQRAGRRRLSHSHRGNAVCGTALSNRGITDSRSLGLLAQSRIAIATASPCRTAPRRRGCREIPRQRSSCRIWSALRT